MCYFEFEVLVQAKYLWTAQRGRRATKRYLFQAFSIKEDTSVWKLISYSSGDTGLYDTLE